MSLQATRDWRKVNKDRVNTNQRNWRNENRTLVRELNNSKYQRQRMEAMDILGGRVCKGCGFEDVRALQIDHINGGGCKEHRKIKSLGIILKIRRIGRLEAQKEYQVLCANCNQIKKHENNEIYYKSVSVAEIG